MENNEVIKKWEPYDLRQGLGTTSTYATNFIISNECIPAIDMTFTSIEIKAETRKLRAQWTPELAQDLHVFHGYDYDDIDYIKYEIQKRVKRRRYKDRKMYIKIIEEWCGVNVNKQIDS